MASNAFGTIFKVTTWGESHGKAIGAVIDGCPAGVAIEESEINAALALRAPGRSPYTSTRRESDRAEILSGVFEGRTSGSPICIMIPNRDADSSPYESIKNLLRPGHANYSYLEKYGIFDYRGGGRASARETAARVAAGAVAKKFLESAGIELLAYIQQIGSLEVQVPEQEVALLRSQVIQNPLFSPDEEATAAMSALIEKAMASGDSLGGVVAFATNALPVGLGDPIYEKLEAKLAHAMLSLPASKGFEMGWGFRSVAMAGSQHNDRFIQREGRVQTETNFAGGTLGGISSGMPLMGRVAFKPAASIRQEQETLTVAGEKAVLQLPSGSRHDPCVAIRAVPVVEAMVALVLADALLLNRCARQ